MRRYGFHGTSHRYVAYRYRQLTGRTREGTRIITLHLGNGASACAIVGGDSVDTSMGFTPLEGLVMGTRSGDLDPAILDFVVGEGGADAARARTRCSTSNPGCSALSGLTADMRELLAEEAEHGDRRARLAIDMFCYRVKKYIGAYLAAMNGADAIVFAGGIGENSPRSSRRASAPDSTGSGSRSTRTGTRRSRAREGRIDRDGSRRRALGDPDRRGTAHRAGYVARGDWSGCEVLMNAECAGFGALGRTRASTATAARVPTPNAVGPPVPSGGAVLPALTRPGSRT